MPTKGASSSRYVQSCSFERICPLQTPATDIYCRFNITCMPLSDLTTKTPWAISATSTTSFFPTIFGKNSRRRQQLPFKLSQVCDYLSHLSSRMRLKLTYMQTPHYPHRLITSTPSSPWISATRRMPRPSATPAGFTKHNLAKMATFTLSEDSKV